MNRNVAHLLAFAALLVAPCVFAANPPFAGANCAISTPPAASGESVAQGAVLKVWPRKAALDAAYKGCQTTWIESRGRWVPLGVAYLEAGQVAGFWAPPPPAALTCSYRSGKATGASAGQCPPASRLVVASMPPGCAKRLHDRAGAEGCKPD